MNGYSDVLLSIGPLEDGRYPLILRPSDRVAVHGQLRAADIDAFRGYVQDAGHAVPAELGWELYRLVLGGEPGRRFEAVLGRPARTRLLLEIEAAELRGLPWEWIAVGPVHAGGTRPPAFLVIRQHRGPDRPAPLRRLPIRILVATSAAAMATREPAFEPERTLLRAYGDRAWLERTIQLGTVAWRGPDELGRLLRGHEPDVLHLVATAEELNERRPLPRLVERGSPRLLLLHVPHQPPDASHAWRRLAAELAAMGVPASYATHFPGNPYAAERFYDGVYDALVHDVPLDVIADTLRDRLFHEFAGDAAWLQPVVLLAPGAENVLRISPLARQTRQRAEQALGELRRMRGSLDRLGRSARALRTTPAVHDDLRSRRDALGELAERLEEGRFRARISTWEHESGGIVPLAEAMEMVERAEAVVGQEQARAADLQEVVEDQAPRVVNTFFRAGQHVLAPDESLGSGRAYEFVVQIGPRLAESIVRSPREVPEDALAPFYREGRLRLQVVLYSDDFRLSRDVRQLLLPRAGPSAPVVFRLRAPDAPRAARLRVGIYFRRNLIQSLIVTARVTAEPRAGLPDGIAADVEYVLSGSLQDLDRLPARALNLLANEAPDGTHTFAVLGTRLKRHFHFSEGELRAKLDAARHQLLKICSRLDRHGRPVGYRFSTQPPDDANRGDEKQFVADIAALARLGYELFYDFLCQKDRDFEDELRESLEQVRRGRTGRVATIQVASTTSARYVVPWAVFYDKPLFDDPQSNTVCPEFLGALRQAAGGGDLARQTCLTDGCPHEDDNDVICPSGFWGFRHIIEQPPSIPVGKAVGRASAEPVPAARGKNREITRRSRDVVQRIVARGEPVVVMGVHQGLAGWAAHRTAIGAVRQPIRLEVRERRRAIGQALAQPQVHFVYFYCHGIRRNGRPALGVGALGREEEFLVTDLGAFRVRWASHPLVFINGCHTVELTPDDLLSFVTGFIHSEAAGIIGTEIAVEEVLAQEFATGFLHGFLREGRTVGEVLRRQRLALLEKYNPLGLAYTPYCSTELRMVVQDAPTLDVLMLEARRSPGWTTDAAGAPVMTEAPALEECWSEAGLKFRIVSNDVRYAPGARARKRHFVAALQQEWSRVVHLAVHGDGANLCLRWSEEESPERRGCVERLRATEIERLELGGAIVVSGACSSGMKTLIDAFLRAGVRAYVAPEADVEWQALVPFFRAFYDALAAGGSVGDSLAAGRAAEPAVGAHYRVWGDADARLERVAPAAGGEPRPAAATSGGP